MVLLGGGVKRRTATMTDANLFGIRVLMCVNRRSRPQDQHCSDPALRSDSSAAVGPHYTSALDLHKTEN